MSTGVIRESHKTKIFSSEDCNYKFCKKTGLTFSWGKTFEDDPEPSKFGPFILDMEISTICTKGCSFCYKGNTFKGSYMGFENFKKIFDKLPRTLTQIAFGIGSLNNKTIYLRRKIK